MEIVQYFLECYFNQSVDYSDLESLLKKFKTQEIESIVLQLTNELAQIINKQNYVFASKLINKYGDRSFDDLEEVKKFVNFLYDKLLDRPTKIKGEDFEKQRRVVFCPVRTPYPQTALNLNLIDRATIVTKDLEIYICKRCKLVWLNENDIKANNAQDYKKFMKANGLKGLWKELKNIDIL